MLRQSFALRTVVAAALLAALLMPAAATAAPPAHAEAAEARSAESVLNLWQFIRDLFGITSAPDAGPDGDLNVVAAGAASGGGGDDADEHPIIGPNDLGDPPASTNSEGDEGPHMDPNG